MTTDTLHRDTLAALCYRSPPRSTRSIRSSRAPFLRINEAIMTADTDHPATLTALCYPDPARVADASAALDPFDAVAPGAPTTIPPDR